MSDNKVVYHKITGKLPIILDENCEDDFLFCVVKVNKTPLKYGKINMRKAREINENTEVVINLCLADYASRVDGKTKFSEMIKILGGLGLNEESSMVERVWKGINEKKN